MNQVKSKGIDQSSVDEKLKNIRRNELAEGLIPEDFEETLSMVLTLLQPKGKRNSLI